MEDSDELSMEEIMWTPNDLKTQPIVIETRNDPFQSYVMTDPRVLAWFQVTHPFFLNSSMAL